MAADLLSIQGHNVHWGLQWADFLPPHSHFKFHKNVFNENLLKQMAPVIQMRQVQQKHFVFNQCIKIQILHQQNEVENMLAYLWFIPFFPCSHSRKLYWPFFSYYFLHFKQFNSINTLISLFHKVNGADALKKGIRR